MTDWLWLLVLLLPFVFATTANPPFFNRPRRSFDTDGYQKGWGRWRRGFTTFPWWRKTSQQTLDTSEPPAGTLFLKDVDGSLSFAGDLTKMTLKSLAGTLTFVGDLTKMTLKSLAGTLTFVGDLTKQTLRVFAGSLSSSGVLTKLALKALAGTLGSTGDLTKQTLKALAGALSFVGSLTTVKFQLFLKTLTATLSFSGSLSAVLQQVVGGLLGGVPYDVAQRFADVRAQLQRWARSPAAAKAVFQATVTVGATAAPSALVAVVQGPRPRAATLVEAEPPAQVRVLTAPMRRHFCQAVVLAVGSPAAEVSRRRCRRAVHGHAFAAATASHVASWRRDQRLVRRLQDDDERLLRGML